MDQIILVLLNNSPFAGCDDLASRCAEDSVGTLFHTGVNALVKFVFAVPFTLRRAAFELVSISICNGTRTQDVSIAEVSCCARAGISIDPGAFTTVIVSLACDTEERADATKSRTFHLDYGAKLKGIPEGARVGLGPVARQMPYRGGGTLCLV